MSAKLLTKQCLEIPRSKGACTGSSKATLVKIPHCWKSRVTAQSAFEWGDGNLDLSLRWIRQNGHCTEACAHLSGPQIWIRNEIIFFLFLNQNICCEYSKEPSH